MNYLITFEGIEGVGKSTQIKLLHDFIIKSGYSSQIIREPGSTPFGEDIRNILLNSDHNITKEAELLLMFASRSALVDSILANQDTDFVLCDRFYDASGTVMRVDELSDWDGRDHLGQIVPPGTYLFHIEASNFTLGATSVDVCPVVVGVNH